MGRMMVIASILQFFVLVDSGAHCNTFLCAGYSHAHAHAHTHTYVIPTET